MPPSKSPRIAVVADAHFHDLEGSYDFPGIVSGERRLAVRMLADTARSTRVFNESWSALRFTLDDIAARGIRHVVLLGDYSDDGQVATIEGVRRLLDDHARRNGMRFYATPGNHDIFGEHGRHRTKRFLTGQGGYRLATSDPDMDDAHAQGIHVTDRMYCKGYRDGLAALPDLGFFRRPDDLFWETPFGGEDDPEARRYEVRSPDGRVTRRLIDASYVTEPFPGVWLLMIDANVFEPISGVEQGMAGDLADSTSAGWNAMLRQKRFVISWISDLASRARRLGKSLLAFSHYPVLDPLDGTHADELSLMGRTSLSDRIPGNAVAEVLSDAGIMIHFSGHLHVNDTAKARTDKGFLINVSVPSLVAFPCGYKIVSVDGGRLDVKTISIGGMPLDPAITGLYRAEVERSGLKAGAMLEAEHYGAFLHAHLGHLVGRRFLKREWPRDMAALLQAITLQDVALLALEPQPVPMRAVFPTLERLRQLPRLSETLMRGLDGGLQAFDTLSSISLVDFLGDWYRLRMGSELALDCITPARQASYSAVAGLYASSGWPGDDAVQALLKRLFRMFDRYRSGLPSRHFSVDLSTGQIVPRDRVEGD